MEGYSFKEKAILVIAVVLAFIVAFAFYQKFEPEAFMKKAGDPVGMSEVNQNLTKSYTGKTAGDDIPRIASASELEQLTENEYVTVSPENVIETGVYSLKPWIDPYKITRGRTSSGRTYSTGRKAPEVRDFVSIWAPYYREYYLIELEDSTYIVAQFDESYKKAFEKGDAVTLPIGQKKVNSQEARTYLREVCGEYGADVTYTLYMVDNEWGQENHFTLFILRFGAAVVLFFALAVALVLASWKVFRFR